MVGVIHWVVGVLHRVLGVLHRVVGVLHRVVGVLHRVLGVLHRVLGVHTYWYGSSCAGLMAPPWKPYATTGFNTRGMILLGV